MNAAAKQGPKSSPRLRVVSTPSTPPAPKTPRKPAQSKTPETMGVVDQVREALKPKTRLATFLGFLLGGFVPLASFVVAHYEVTMSKPLYSQLGMYLVLGGLIYSAKTVYSWGERAFNSPVKAVGFVVLLEGVMVGAQTPWLSFAALTYLVCVNGIATGCNLAVRADK